MISLLLQKDGKFLSWQHIIHLYNLEVNPIHPGVKLCPKLTKDHIWLTSFSKMRVNLAAQVCHLHV